MRINVNIQKAVLENKPEMITHHPSYNPTRLKEMIIDEPDYDASCCVDFFEDSSKVAEFGEFACHSFNCDDCLFDCSQYSKKITLQSVLEWLESANNKPLDQESLPIEYCF